MKEKEGQDTVENWKNTASKSNFFERSFQTSWNTEPQRLLEN